jgi:hypothetical protein
MSIYSMLKAALRAQGWILARVPEDDELHAAELVDLLTEDNADGFTVTLYETSSCAWEFHHPGERRRWPDLRASLSQACRTTSPGTVGDDLLPTVSP